MLRANPWLLVLLGVAAIVLAVALTLQGLGVTGAGGTFSGARLLAGGVVFALGLTLIGNGAWKLKQP